MKANCKEFGSTKDTQVIVTGQGQKKSHENPFHESSNPEVISCKTKYKSCDKVPSRMKMKSRTLDINAGCPIDLAIAPIRQLPLARLYFFKLEES